VSLSVLECPCVPECPESPLCLLVLKKFSRLLGLKLYGVELQTQEKSKHLFVS
jgi:hypothetical protein